MLTVLLLRQQACSLKLAIKRAADRYMQQSEQQQVLLHLQQQQVRQAAVLLHLEDCVMH
jgi:hypothetical protein